MAQSPTPGSSIQPLNVGNVVSAGIRLYGDHLKAYLGIAAVATGWALIPFLILIPIVLFFAQEGADLSPLWIIAPILLALALFCFAKSLSNSALISRLCFNELINQPESIKAGRAVTNARLWKFLWAAILTGVLFLGIIFALYILAAIAVGVPTFALITVLSSNGQNGFLLPLVIGLLSIVIVIFLLVAVCWFVARLLIVEVPLAIEDGLTASKTIGRSWELTQNNGWRVFFIAFIAFLITIPLQLIVQVASSVIQGIVSQFLEPESPLFLTTTFITAYALGLVSSVFTIPFWQAIKAVIYYDLRSRREGLGLELRDRGSSF